MATSTPRRIARRWTLPIRLHVATVLIVLLLVSGGLLAWTGYSQSRAALWSASLDLVEQLTENVRLSIQATYAPATSAVDLISRTAIAARADPAARPAAVPLLAEALHGSPELAAIYVGYDDGDLLLLRRITGPAVRDRLGAPPAAAFSLETLETGADGERRGTDVFLDGNLAELERREKSDTGYDPRARPWYVAARDRSDRALTAPYRFALSGLPGVTVSRRLAGGDGVVGADVSLEQLSGTLRESRLSPSAELVIVGGGRRILAYAGPEGGAAQWPPAGDALPSPETLGSATVSQAADLLHPGDRSTTFRSAGRRWTVRLRDLPTRGTEPWRLALLVPEDELLRDATALLHRSAVITGALLLLTVPIGWGVASLLARPLVQLARETALIRRFDFSAPVTIRSRLREVDELATSLGAMKSTIRRFLGLIGSLSREPAYERLVDRVLEETMEVGAADAGVVYLLAEDDALLEPASARARNGEAPALDAVAVEGQGADAELTAAAGGDGVRVFQRRRQDAPHALAAFHDALGCDVLRVTAVPLPDRAGRLMGMLCLVNRPGEAAEEDGTDDIEPGHDERTRFVHAVSGFAAVSLESQRLLKIEKALLEAFIRLIAGAIDAKSPYTGGHCQRVPALTAALARAACDSDAEPFRDFQLDDEAWEALHVASWLHDCGKVTTPEYVVDKATKLETIYDRLHEVRMRFEVLKRDAQTRCWRAVADGERDRAAAEAALAGEWRTLDEEFAFIAECNEGGEFMAEDRIERLHAIAARTWQRTLDDRIGISWEERARKERTPAAPLPVTEPLLADRDEHLILRDPDPTAPEGPAPAGRFRMEVPEHAYNRGELYNLAVPRGTLTAEERYKINDHIVQTIVMLEKLPFPRRLREVPAIAGGHHEKMDGTGYPRRLSREDMPLTARMMAIADIFEALTASDRPYKKAKTVAEALRIMGFMKKDQHIDAELFELFVSAGVPEAYGREFLLEWQREG